MQLVYDFTRSIDLPQPPDEIRIYAYRKPEDLGHAWAEEMGWSVEDSVEFWRTSPPRGAPDSIWAKVDYPYSDIRDSHLRWLTHVAAHEMVHSAYQIGLLGLNTDHFWFKENPQYHPYWLAEGMADLYVHLALSHAGQREYRQSRYMFAEAATTLNVCPSLRSRKGYPSCRKRNRGSVCTSARRRRWSCWPPESGCVG